MRQVFCERTYGPEPMIRIIANPFGYTIYVFNDWTGDYDAAGDYPSRRLAEASLPLRCHVVSIDK